jgi:uncharacterized membrane protein
LERSVLPAVGTCGVHYQERSGDFQTMRKRSASPHQAAALMVDPAPSGKDAVSRRFPVAAGFFLGLGLGGFFDGIVLHQILQWHHLFTSAGYPADSLPNLEFNTFLDGLFHATTYIFVVLGLVFLWRTAHKNHLWWSGKMLAGTMLMGFGIFNLVEGIVDHQLLGLHHVNETVPRSQWVYWDIGFLIWGAAMSLAGWALYKSGRKESPGEQT